MRATTGSAVPSGPFPKTARSPLGTPETLRAPAERIVSIALSEDEILIDLVAPQRIVGVTTFIDDRGMSPVSDRALPSAARVTGEPEAILALRPDIVFASAYTRPEALSLLVGAGIPVVGIGSLATFDDVLRAVTTTGDAVGEPERAKAIVAAAKVRIAAVTSRPCGHPRVLVWDGGFTDGGGTLEDEMIVLSGGVNVAAKAGIVGASSLTEEAAIALDPDVILVPMETRVVRKHAPELLGGAPIWRAVRAAARGNVFGVPRAWIGSVSHHAVRGLEAVAEIVESWEP
jgi:iron complex transport system substrate-binding protein